MNSSMSNESLSLIYDTIFSSWIYIYLCLSLSSHSLLNYLILQHSPPSFTTVRLLLMNISICQMMESLMFSIVGPRQVIEGSMLGLIPLGPLRYFGIPDIGLFIYQMMNAFIISSCFAILALMYYRYSKIRISTTKINAKILIALTYMPAAINTILGRTFLVNDLNAIMVFLVANKTEYDLGKRVPFFGFQNTGSFIFKYNTTVLVGAGIILPILILYWRNKISKIMEMRRDCFSDRTVKATQMLMKSLATQALLPISTYSCTITLYVSAQLLGYRPLIGEYLTYFVSVLPCIFDPWIVIYFISPYKRWIIHSLLRCLGEKQASVATVTHTGGISNKKMTIL